MVADQQIGGTTGIAADETGVYWTTPGSVMWALGPGLEPKALASGLPQHKRSPVIDAKHVYWANGNANGIFEMPKAGGTVTALVPDGGESTYEVAADATMSTGSETWAARRVPISGGTATMVLHKPEFCDRHARGRRDRD